MARAHLIGLAAALALTAVVASACTVQGFRTVIFENDLGRPVVLARCRAAPSVSCARPSKRVRIAAGRTHAATVDYAVESPAGALLRCVVLYWTRDPGDVPRIKLSRTPRWSRQCPDSTPGGSAP